MARKIAPKAERRRCGQEHAKAVEFVGGLSESVYNIVINTGMIKRSYIAMGNLNITLPDELKTFVDQQAAAHGFSSTNEYLRDLIGKQHDIEQLRQKLLDGANSGPGKKIDDPWFAELRAHAAR